MHIPTYYPKHQLKKDYAALLMPLAAFARDNRGQANVAAILGLFGVLIVGGAFLAVGTMVNSEIYSSVTIDANDTAAQDAYTSVKSNTWKGFKMGSITLIVIGATAGLSVLFVLIRIVS